MKVGDKVICIRQYNINSSNYFVKDKIYLITYINKGYFSIDDRLNVNNINYSNDFSDHFITLAEFREQRINKILE